MTPELQLILNPSLRGDLHVGQVVSLLGSDWRVDGIITTSPDRVRALLTRIGETP